MSVGLFERVQNIKTISDEERTVINYGLSQSYLACVDNLKIARPLLEENAKQNYDPFIALASKFSLTKHGKKSGGTWARRRKHLEKAIGSVDPNTADVLMIRSNVAMVG